MLYERMKGYSFNYFLHCLYRFVFEQRKQARIFAVTRDWKIDVLNA